MIGKLPPERLAEVVARSGAADPTVALGPGYGEDAAAIELDGRYLVVSSDPLSLAAERIGTLGVHVACNDVAVTGADPRWLTSVVFLPEEDGRLETITEQLDAGASSLGVSIVGGHTEYAPALDRPLLSLTCLGLADEVISSGGARPGDRALLTKGAGIEGTAILATDFRASLEGVPEETIERAAGFFGEISVVPDAEVLRGFATAMHDPTEGGFVDGALELASASGVELDVERGAVPIREETEQLCAAMDVDPLRIFGSGAVLATVPEGESYAALSALAERGIDAAEIGRVVESEEPALRLDGERITEPVRDDLYALWE